MDKRLRDAGKGYAFFLAGITLTPIYSSPVICDVCFHDNSVNCDLYCKDRPSPSACLFACRLAFMGHDNGPAADPSNDRGGVPPAYPAPIPSQPSYERSPYETPEIPTNEPLPEPQPEYDPSYSYDSPDYDFPFKDPDAPPGTCPIYPGPSDPNTPVITSPSSDYELIPAPGPSTCTEDGILHCQEELHYCLERIGHNPGGRAWHFIRGKCFQDRAVCEIAVRIRCAF